MNVIKVEKLARQFGDLVAVDHISFKVQQGEIFGFLGPNGAGKSTTISMLATLLAPTEGDARIAGHSIRGDRNAVRRSIGLVFQDPSLDDRLTAEENLRFHARLYGVSMQEYAARAEEVLKLVDLDDRRDHIVKTFSGGMKRRLEIARGLIHYPAVLFLDEPTIGLDPQTRAHLWEYILKLKSEKNMTIFMSTHYMNEAEYCDRIAVIDHGNIVALDTPDALKEKVGGDIVRLASSDDDALMAILKDTYGLAPRTEDSHVVVEVEGGEHFLPKLLHDTQKVSITSIEMRKPSLDDVFLQLTGRAIREQEASPRDAMRQAARARGRA